MEHARKNLKISSIVVLIFTGLSLINIVFELLLGDLNNAELLTGSPENILLITKILLLAVAVLLLLPQLYIGFKGLKVAKSPNHSRGHIIWARILLVLALASLISPIVAILNQGSLMENVSSILSILVEVIVYFEYVKYAKELSRTL